MGGIHFASAASATSAGRAESGCAFMCRAGMRRFVQGRIGAARWCDLNGEAARMPSASGLPDVQDVPRLVSSSCPRHGRAATCRGGSVVPHRIGDMRGQRPSRVFRACLDWLRLHVPRGDLPGTRRVVRMRAGAARWRATNRQGCVDGIRVGCSGCTDTCPRLHVTYGEAPECIGDVWGRGEMRRNVP